MHTAAVQGLLEAAAHETGRTGRPALVYVLAAILAVAAFVLFVRLLLWDRLNQESPNQDDPLGPAAEDRR